MDPLCLRMADALLHLLFRPESPALHFSWRGIGAALGLVCLGAGGGPLIGWAQAPTADTLNLIERYRTARQEVLARRTRARGRVARVLPPARLPTATDSLYRPDAPSDSSAEQRAGGPAFPIETARAVHRLERGWFQDKFGDTDWSFLGSATYLTRFDTTYTRELRARLQAQFGAPSRTLAEGPEGEGEGEPQFEYWFVVNDSIPVRVMDANGPRDRGLIVAADRRFRDRLRALRAALLRPLRQPERAPYVDYYREPSTDEHGTRWYRTGFDGRSFFLERISRSEILRGRRPRLDSTRAGAP